MNKTRPDFRTISWDGKCPHCGEIVVFRLKTDFGAFGIKTPDADWLASLSKTESELLALAQSTGVFNSFDRTFRECKGATGNPAKSFLKFLSGMKLLDLPDAGTLALRSEFPKSQTAVYHCGDVSVIVVDGEMRMFVPTAHLFKPKPKPQATAVSAANGALKVNGTVQVKALTKDMQDFRTWVKTRMGYVPIEGAMFLKEMRKRCYGAFGTREKSRSVGAGK